MNKFVFIFLLGTSLFLSACWEMEQEVWIHKDGSGRFRMVVGVSKGIANLMAKNKEGLFPFSQIEDPLKNDPNVKKITTSQFEKNEYKYFSLDLDIYDVSKTEELQDRIFQSMKTNEELSKYFNGKLDVKELKNGNISFTYILNPGKKAPPPDNSPFSAAKMAQAMYNNRYFSFTLHAPDIVFTNGKSNSENTTTTWKIPIADLVSGGEQKLKTIFSMPFPYFWIIVVNVVILLVIAGLYFAFRKD